MKCEQIRERLPLLVYGELDADEARPLTDHLAACESCRYEMEALQAARRSLDAPAVPEVSVDVASIHARSIAVQARMARRWKRLAFAGGALAASLLALLLIRPDIRIGNGEFAIRWGAPVAPPGQSNSVDAGQRASASVSPDELEERIRVLSDLVQVLHRQMENADEKRREELEILTSRVDLLRIQSQKRWDETNRDVGALYTAQFGRKD